MDQTRPSPSRVQPGFSLIEVTIALGIVVFALVAIIGLLPVAVKTSAGSERETQATFIAQNIFSDLVSGYGPTNTFITSGEDVLEPGGRTAVNLAADSDKYVIYNLQGQPMGTSTASKFITPQGSNAVYGAKIAIRRNPAATNLSRVEVQVETPVDAPGTNRTRYKFVTELPNR